MRRKGVTKQLEIWNGLTVNYINDDIFLSCFESMLA